MLVKANLPNNPPPVLPLALLLVQTGLLEGGEGWWKLVYEQGRAFRVKATTNPLQRPPQG